MSPYRSDAYNNKLRHFWSTFVHSLYIIFVLAALVCMVYLFYGVIYRVSVP
jgi:ABC-type multidrug transport system permease subunit